MSDENKSSEQILSNLRQVRDELAVQVNLGKAEAKDEWAKLEAKFEDLQSKCKPAEQAVEDTAAGVAAAAELAAAELKEGYEKLRKLL